MRFYTMPELAVVGNNPEMADMDNPRGDIIREVHLLVAEDEHGRRWIVQSLGENPDPVALGWTPHYAVYGSSAYETEQQPVDWEMDRRG